MFDGCRGAVTAPNEFRAGKPRPYMNVTVTIQINDNWEGVRHMDEGATKVGKVTHYFSHLMVGTVKLTAGVKKGDQVAFKGNTTDFKQTLDDMQFDHQPVDSAEAGKEVGLKVNDKVRDGDGMFRLS